MLFIHRKPWSFAPINVSACVCVVSKILPETVRLTISSAKFYLHEAVFRGDTALLLWNLMSWFRWLRHNLLCGHVEIAQFNNFNRRTRHWSQFRAILIQSWSHLIPLRYISDWNVLIILRRHACYTPNRLHFNSVAFTSQVRSDAMLVLVSGNLKMKVKD